MNLKLTLKSEALGYQLSRMLQEQAQTYRDDAARTPELAKQFHDMASDLNALAVQIEDQL
jgi:hypothetical protein